MRSLKGNKRVMIAAGAVLGLLVFCLVGFLVYSIATNSGSNQVVSKTKTPSAVPPAGKTETVVPKGAETTVPTRVISKEITSTVETKATEVKTQPTAVPPKVSSTKATPSPKLGQVTTVTKTVVGPPEQLLLNGDFEAGFSDTGVALNWHSFQNDAVLVIFSSEIAPYIDSGHNGQRITLVQATQSDRYAGIYQQVGVVPSQTYTVSLHGHVRSVAGDIKKSSYGYRMQYAIDFMGGTNWQAIKPTAWVELPWDEQPLYGSEARLLSFTTQITPTAEKMTLFVRAWNKWADLNESQYSFDNFSLVGPGLVQIITVASTESVSDTGTAFAPGSGGKETLVDQGLPVTGTVSSKFNHDGQLLGGLFVLLVLSGRVIYRIRRRR